MMTHVGGTRKPRKIASSVYSRKSHVPMVREGTQACCTKGRIERMAVLRKKGATLPGIKT